MSLRVALLADLPICVCVCMLGELIEGACAVVSFLFLMGWMAIQIDDERHTLNYASASKGNDRRKVGIVDHSQSVFMLRTFACGPSNAARSPIDASCLVGWD